MTRKTKREFILTVPALEDVSEADWKAYILDAVGSMKGCYNPDDPIFELDSDDVKVKRNTLNGRLDTLHKENVEWRELVFKLANEKSDLLAELAKYRPANVVGS